MLPRWTLRALVALALAVGLALPSDADAQVAASVTLNQASFRFLRQVRRPDGQMPNWISRRDCLEDSPDAPPDFQRPTIRMSPNVQGSRTNWSLQVWVGAVDCTDPNLRTGTTQRCWKVAEATNPNRAVVQLEISPRAVAAGVPMTRGDAPFGETDAAACDQQLEVSVNFYIMLVDGANAAQGTTARWENTTLDLLGPPAPTALRAGVAEGALVAHWTVPVEGDFDDIDGFAVYCDEAGGVSPSVGGPAGTGNAPGAGACTSANLTPGQLPPLDLQCARSGGRGTREARAGGLQNGVEYAIAVAGVDRVGNSGPLSPRACGTPEPVTTFFEAYREAGGVGGGGFCAWAPSGSAGGFGAALLGSAAYWLRRRRTRG